MNKGLFQPLAAVGLVLLTLFAACGGERGTGTSTAGLEGSKKGRQRDAGVAEIESWVDVYYPEAAQPGYTMLLYRRRHPTLIDMNGRIVHAWPEVRAAGRVRLLADGSILVIGQDGAVRQYDWEGEPLWEFRLEGDDFPHHDLIQLASGARLVLAHDIQERLDYLVEVTREGEIVWRWDAAEHLADELSRAGDVVNRTHINSVHEIGENRWWAGGDTRFRPGNILISARNLNAIYVIDKTSGAVVWTYYGELDHQHEALMVPAGRPGAGNILVFNNGLRDLHHYRRSSVLELDPSDGSTVWSYQAPSFFSSTGGTQQSLANGNLLITSSRGGRIFEVDRQGKIVWQLSPTYKPMRVERYPYDHTPQLAALPRPAEERVERRNPRRHVDEDLYTFALPHQTRDLKVGDRELTALKETTICRRLLLPERPELSVGWGVKPRKGQPPREVEVSLAVTVKPEGDGEPRVVLAREERFQLGGEDPTPLSEPERIGLEEFGLQAVELCLSALGTGERPAPPVFFWGPPGVRSSNRTVAEQSEAVDPAVKAVQDKHLKALGYID